jgi:dihydropteroate synthase
MGILNATPDSFSGDGRDARSALAHGLALIEAGADMLDVGGESTRPGAQQVDEAEEIYRVEALVAKLVANTRVPLSIDTMKPAVARRAVAAGAAMWNDVTALRHASDSAATAAELGCEVVLMHMRGDPRTMQIAPTYADVVTEVIEFLEEQAEVAIAAGVDRAKIWLDPGIGFGKTLQHNLALLKALPRVVALGFPVLLGASRKGFIGKIDPTARSPADRLGGSLAVALAGARAGVAAVRVHDVYETTQALSVEAAISEDGLG